MHTYNPDCLAGATANSLAEASGTSPATVIRFCRKLGFGGFTELKNSAANYIVETAWDMSLRRGDDVHTVKSNVISYTKMIMDELNDILDDEALEKAAKLIAEAKSLVIVREGGSGTISRAAYDIFLKLAIPCRCVEDLIFQAMEISMMGKDDLLLIVVNSGRTWNVLQNAAYAKGRGIKIVGIVGPANSPLSKYLDVEILMRLFSSDYFSGISAARACELTTISILHSIIAVGDTVRLALEAAALHDQSVEARVLDMHTVKPLYTEAVNACIADIGKIVTVEDHNIINALGSAVCECVAEAGRGIVRRMGVQDQFGESAPYERLLAKNGITTENIVAQAKSLL